jgi:2-amino-4-hydroxy-6-hydroxymethyldihydropteridine diphosphokinase
MNRLLHAQTTLSPTLLTTLLKQIEQETQRTKQYVTIDLDLMQYDNQRYHLEDWQRPYIQNLIGFM